MIYIKSSKFRISNVVLFTYLKYDLSLNFGNILKYSKLEFFRMR